MVICYFKVANFTRRFLWRSCSVGNWTCEYSFPFHKLRKYRNRVSIVELPLNISEGSVFERNYLDLKIRDQLQATFGHCLGSRLWKFLPKLIKGSSHSSSGFFNCVISHVLWFNFFLKTVFCMVCMRTALYKSLFTLDL